ncbi:MAG: DUF599 domain-containing protein [Dongiaceae bacterium]
MWSEWSILSVLPALDAAALAWFLVLWTGYNVAVDRILRRPVGLNQHMHLVRQGWMGALLRRDDRVIDAILMGHLIHSVSFFASTTMLLVAALVGILAAVNQAFVAVMSLTFTVTTSLPLFELKLVLLAGIFVYAFFKFTWALRQYNYACALIGSMPTHVTLERRSNLAEPSSRVLTLAVTNFNGGLRAYTSPSPCSPGSSIRCCSSPSPPGWFWCWSGGSCGPGPSMPSAPSPSSIAMVKALLPTA